MVLYQVFGADLKSNMAARVHNVFSKSSHGLWPGELKMKCVCKTQMMPLPDHQNPVDKHTSNMCINIFGATALIFCRMFIHIIEMCMSTAF
jgi:hypothetical protein